MSAWATSCSFSQANSCTNLTSLTPPAPPSPTSRSGPTETQWRRQSRQNTRTFPPLSRMMRIRRTRTRYRDGGLLLVTNVGYRVFVFTIPFTVFRYNIVLQNCAFTATTLLPTTRSGRSSRFALAICIPKNRTRAIVSILSIDTISEWDDTTLRIKESSLYPPRYLPQGCSLL